MVRIETVSSVSSVYLIGGISMLSHQDLQIAKVKAAIFESRNVEALISKAIRAYNDPRLELAPKGDITIYYGSNNEKEVVIKNAPLVEFEGNVYENTQLTATIEEILDSGNLGRFPNIQSGSIEFEELLK